MKLLLRRTLVHQEYKSAMCKFKKSAGNTFMFYLLTFILNVQECDPEMNSVQAATLRLNVAMKGEL